MSKQSALGTRFLVYTLAVYSEVLIMSKSNKYQGDGSLKPVNLVLYQYEHDGIVFSHQDGSHPFKLVACCLKHGKQTITGFEHAFEQLADDQKAEFENSFLAFAKYMDTNVEQREFYYFPYSVEQYWLYQNPSSLEDDD